MSKKITIDEHITRCRKAHGTKYTYDFSSLINVDTKIPITCPLHGVFTQALRSHQKGYGCPICHPRSTDNSKNARRLPVSRLLEMFKEKHGNTYIYNIVNQVSDRESIDIECRIHGVFTQNVKVHKMGSGCQACGEIAQQARNSGKPATLYLVYLEEDKAYKIGVTTNEVKRRFRGKLKGNYRIVWETPYPSMLEAVEQEQLIVCAKRNDRKTNVTQLTEGKTEIFCNYIMQPAI